MSQTLEQMLRTVDTVDNLGHPVGLKWLPLRLGIVAGLLRAAPEGTGPRLLWRYGDSQVHALAIDRELIIGRATGCDLVMNSRLVSRRHCRIWNHFGAIWLEDLKSTHGTQVNDRQVDRSPLNDGDIIQIGGMALVFTAT